MLALACSGQGEGQNSGSGEGDLGVGACNATEKSVGDLSRLHVDVCSALDYPDNPPAGGQHYPVWAAYQSFSFPVPRGFWVHDLEHGGVVFTYHCPAGCAEEVSEVEALIEALPIDAACAANEPRRIVLTPDPLLDVRWGISAWGHTLRAECVDADRFRQFYSEHAGRGPEAVCGQGSDFDGVPPCQ